MRNISKKGMKGSFSLFAVNISRLFHAQHFVDGIDDVGCLGKASGFEGFCVWHWRINTAHSPHGCVEMEECFVFHDASADFRTNA